MIAGLFFAWLPVLIMAAGLLVVAGIYRLKWYKPVVYRYSLAGYLAKRVGVRATFIPVTLFVLRLVALALLVLAVGKPQVPDRRTHVIVNGIDIMLVIDASGTMRCFDDLKDRRTRIDIAQQEAIRFVRQREHDAIGVVAFARGALTACPLTHDHTVVCQVLESLDVGSMLYPDGTWLSQGIITALNRLKDSSSPSKIMIVLTDGQPEGDPVTPAMAVDLARTMGVKIYTIGVGSPEGGYGIDAFGYPFRAATPLNEQLLSALAQHTGGAAYRACNAADMRRIYDTIDTLEKRPQKINWYARYYDLFDAFAWLALLLVSIDLVLSGLVWRLL